MQKLFLIVFSFLLIGCEKHKEQPQLIAVTNTPVTTATEPFYVIGAGQSNMEYEKLTDTFPDSVNVALGGTYIREWQKGTPLYNKMLDALKAHSNSSVFFWQGEAEGMSQTYVPWAEDFTKMVRALRQDGINVKIVYVQIGQIASAIYPSTPYWKTIQDEQASVSLPNVFMISAADMFPGGDAVHYSQVQYRTMQERALPYLE